MLDFAGPAGFCGQLASAAGRCATGGSIKSYHSLVLCCLSASRVSCRVVVVDHHKTAAAALTGKKDLPDNLEVNLDMKHSGAQLALQHFKPEVHAA